MCAVLLQRGQWCMLVSKLSPIAAECSCLCSNEAKEQKCFSTAWLWQRRFLKVQFSVKTVFILFLPMLPACLRATQKVWKGEQLTVVTSGIWKPSLISGVQSLSLFCVELCSCCYGYIFEEEICDTHMVISLLLAKAWKTEMSISQQVSLPNSHPRHPRLHTHTHTDAGSCTSKHTNTHNQQTLSDPHCPVSATHPSSSTVSLLSTTFWKHSVTRTHRRTHWSEYPHIHKPGH